MSRNRVQALSVQTTHLLTQHPSYPTIPLQSHYLIQRSNFSSGFTKGVDWAKRKKLKVLHFRSIEFGTNGIDQIAG